MTCGSTDAAGIDGVAAFCTMPRIATASGVLPAEEPLSVRLVPASIPLVDGVAFALTATQA
jgi:hypothetical protein